MYPFWPCSDDLGKEPSLPALLRTDSSWLTAQNLRNTAGLEGSISCRVTVRLWAKSPIYIIWLNLHNNLEKLLLLTCY